MAVNPTTSNTHQHHKHHRQHERQLPLVLHAPHAEPLETLLGQQNLPQCGQRSGRIHIAALLEHITVAVVLVARRARLREHIGHIVRSHVPVERTLAHAVRALAAQFARLRGRIAGARHALARLQAVRQADRAGAFAHVADELLVADGLVRLVDRRRTLRPEAVAEALVAAAVVVATLVAEAQLARVRAARPLRRTATGGRRQRARPFGRIGMAGHWKAAGVLAVVLPAAVALLAGIDDAVAADGDLRFCWQRWRVSLMCC